MPLEVRQIAIQMQVAAANDCAPVGLSGAKRGAASRGGSGNANDQARLIEQCVEAVLAELARRAER